MLTYNKIMFEESEEIHEYKNGLDFFKYSKSDQIWYIHSPCDEGKYLFSFDQKTIFNFWTDYPGKLSAEQIELFKKENPEMASLK